MTAEDLSIFLDGYDDDTPVVIKIGRDYYEINPEDLLADEDLFKIVITVI